MRKLFLLRGAPGSGKSSFIARHHLLPYAISGDAIRLLLANLTVYYDQKTDVLHQVIPRHVTEQTKRMKDILCSTKLSFIRLVCSVTCRGITWCRTSVFWS